MLIIIQKWSRSSVNWFLTRTIKTQYKPLAFKEQLRGIEENAKKEEEALQRKENIQYALIALGIIILFIFLSFTQPQLYHQYK